ncbi:MAG: hypothetical protein HZB66_02135 [Candidatus Aenigmarchaeota archaeon]|nr:hypothetical protein [Candidatus Aenigmarchaeota archaeon]
MDYKSAGVDIELGDDASKVLYNAARQTWERRASDNGLATGCKKPWQ